MSSRIVIAGGSGFIGQGLIEFFRTQGFDVAVLSRSTRVMEGVTVAKWSGESLGDWTGLFNGAKAVINLSGEPVTLRWTDENKRRILKSRVKSTETIGKAIRTCATAPDLWINASAVGYYGDQGDQELDERSPAGEGFLPETCVAWERAHDSAETPGVRKAKVRIGTVLGRNGGAFPELSGYARKFLGGTLGNGRQWMPWIHVVDLVRIFDWVIENRFEGVVNGVGPEPVRNADFMSEMRRAAGRPWSPPAPPFAIKLIGALRGVQADVILQSQRAKSKVLSESTFEYKFPTLSGALSDLFRDPSGG